MAKAKQANKLTKGEKLVSNLTNFALGVNSTGDTVSFDEGDVKAGSKKLLTYVRKLEREVSDLTATPIPLARANT